MGDRIKNERGGAVQGSLLHPAFLVALVVLVVNDHVLKGSGLLPGAVTGKLSDVAWLVVAPVVTSALANRAGRRGRYLAAGAPAVFFVALQLIPALPCLVERSSLLIGLPMRVWPDPTDLWALLILPVPFLILSAAPEQSAVRRKVSRLSLALASLACVATSPLPTSPSPPGILNHSEDTATLTLQAYEGELVCSQPLAQVARAVEAQTPVLEREFTLSQGYVAELPTSTDVDCLQPGLIQDAAPPCRLAVADLGGSSRFLVRSTRRCYGVEGESRSGIYVPLYETPYRWTAVLRGKPGDYTLEGGSEIEVLELAAESP